MPTETLIRRRALDPPPRVRSEAWHPRATSEATSIRRPRATGLQLQTLYSRREGTNATKVRDLLRW